MNLRCIAKLWLAWFTVINVVLPIGAYAAPGQYHARWIDRRPNNYTTVYFPLPDWVDIVRLRPAATRSAPDVEMIRGEGWIRLNHMEAGMLGLASNQVTEDMRQFAGGGVQLFARYSPANAMLAIAMTRIEKRPDGYVYFSTGHYTPHEGERSRANGHFRTELERAIDREGYNPFAANRGDKTDPVYYRISWAGALVALGQAMTRYKVPYAWLAVDDVHLQQTTEESGNIFRSTVTVKVDAYAGVQWWFVSAKELQPYSDPIAHPVVTGAICAEASQLRKQADGTFRCDEPEHTVAAGVWASRWIGGNLPGQTPADREHIVHWEQSHSGWSVLTYTVLTGLITWGAGALYSGMTGIAEGGARGLILDLFTPAQFALVTGGTYAAGSTANSGLGDLTRDQKRYSGPTGAAAIAPVPAQGELDARIRAGVEDRLIQSEPSAALAGVRKQYRGDCPVQWTLAQCNAAGLSAGAIDRADTYTESNPVRAAHSRYAQCKAAGYVGSVLSKCAAPVPKGAFSQPPQ